MSEHPEATEPAHPSPGPSRRPRPAAPHVPWTTRAALPVPTMAVFALFALVLWVNAIVNHYRFNVVIALLGTVPLLVVLARGAAKARAAG